MFLLYVSVTFGQDYLGTSCQRFTVVFFKTFIVSYRENELSVPLFFFRIRPVKFVYSISLDSCFVESERTK